MSDESHIRQTSADEYEYTDERGIKIADQHWECPDCGDDGLLMHRPGSKNTCANCFWVRNGKYNSHVLADWSLLYRDGQRLLAANDEAWHGTPGSVGTALRRLFDTSAEAESALQNLHSTGSDRHSSGDPAATTLGEF